MTYNKSQFEYHGEFQTFTANAKDLANLSEFFSIKIPGRTLSFNLTGRKGNAWEYTCTTGAFKAMVFNG